MIQNIMTLGGMASEVGDLIEDSSEGRKDSVKKALARLYDSAVAEFEYASLMRSDTTGLRSGALASSGIKTLESGEPECPLPVGVGRLKSLHHQSTVAPRTLIAVDAQELFDRAGSELNTTGMPIYYAEVGFTAQWRKQPIASFLTCYSSVANNNGTKTVRVWYRTRDAYASEVQFQDISGDFSTGLALGQGATFPASYSIESVQLPVGWVGDFFIRSADADGTKIVDIPSYVIPVTANTDLERSYRRKLIRVWPVPDQDYGLTVVWKHMPRRLIQDGDQIEVPIASYLIYACAAEIMAVMGLPQKAAIFAAMAEQSRESSKNQNAQAASRSIRPKYRSMLGTMDIPTW